MDGTGDPPDPPGDALDKMEVAHTDKLPHGVDNMRSTPEAPRVRVYPESARGPYTVFFRKIDKPLNLLLISAELHQRFKTVKEIKQVELRKIRVTMSDRNEANEVVILPRFRGLYRVYIPSAEVEIDGVAYDEMISPEEVLQYGQGKFINPQLPMLPVLECERLAMREEVASNEASFTPSNAMRVTFAGTALPDLLCINGALLNVRLYSPKVMLCRKCGRLGHTSKYCSSKPRCVQCGDQHDVSACEKANNTVQKCLLCNEIHDSIKNCQNYQAKRKEHKKILQNRSKSSYEALVQQVSPRFESENVFEPLCHQKDDEHGDGESSFGSFRPPMRKRKRDFKGKPDSPKSDMTRKDKRTEPPSTAGHQQAHSSQDPFPPLPRGSDIPGFRRIETQNIEQLPRVSGQNISELIKTICKFLNIDQFWIDMIEKLVPLLTALWNKFSPSSTPLETPAQN